MIRYVEVKRLYIADKFANLCGSKFKNMNNTQRVKFIVVQKNPHKILLLNSIPNFFISLNFFSFTKKTWTKLQSF